MKLITILFTASIVVFGMACGNEAPKTESTETVDPNSAVTPSTSETAPATEQSQMIQPATESAAPAGETTTTAPGMNPPHGQPGHRCDIAVGAPLPK